MQNTIDHELEMNRICPFQVATAIGKSRQDRGLAFRRQQTDALRKGQRQ